MADTDAADLEKLKRHCDRLAKKIAKLELDKREYEAMVKIWKQEKRTLERFLKEKTGELAILSEMLNKNLKSDDDPRA